MFEDQSKAERDEGDSDVSSSEPTAGRDGSPLESASSPLRFRRLSRDSDPELEPHEEHSSVRPSSVDSPRRDGAKSGPRLEDEDFHLESWQRSESIFTTRNSEHKAGNSQRKETESFKKGTDRGNFSGVKDGLCSLVEQPDSTSQFSQGHLQSLVLSGFHSQSLFNQLNAGHPLFVHPGQFAVAPGAFSAMGMGHFLASVSGMSGLENGSLSAPGVGGTASTFPFHLSQQALASQGIPMSTFGGLFPYPYAYMAAAASAFPASGALSSPSGNPFLCSSPSQLRFSPYQLPVSIPPSTNLLTTGRPSSLTVGSDSSKSCSREASPTPDHQDRKAGDSPRTCSPRTILKQSINELQNIQRLVSGLQRDSMTPSSRDSPK
ncbi:hypothetical protein GJAV_G00061320 [Gymnothorax javanicus]|nr:hypothetical protein GJAV_G00061320 [Gymnothorax javanicus]